MENNFTISCILPASPDKVYAAYLNSKQHSQMTGDHAVVDPKVGGSLNAGDGYIHAVFITLDPGKRIVHTWRTTEFPPNSEDSIVEILFESVESGAKLTLIHTHIPSRQAADYKSGWKEFYFTPMKVYFEKKKKMKNHNQLTMKKRNRREKEL